MELEFRSTLAYADVILAGFLLTARISFVAFAAAFVIAVIGAVARRSALLPVRALAALYVELFRNTPLLLQVFVLYFALPSAGVRFDPITAGTVALALNIGAYLTEVLRAGIQSVSHGQVEAAHSIGLSSVQTFRHVVFPVALRNAYPPAVNMFVTTILGSSLLSAISVTELTGTALFVATRTFRSIEVFGIAAVGYIVLTSLSSTILMLLGRKLFPADAKA